jgi:hypothetical protein
MPGRTKLALGRGTRHTTPSQEPRTKGQVTNHIVADDDDDTTQGGSAAPELSPSLSPSLSLRGLMLTVVRNWARENAAVYTTAAAIFRERVAWARRK